MINLNSTSTEVIAQEVPWFETWFNTVHYRNLYRNRDDKEAAFFIDNLVKKLGLPQNSAILDAGCGNGRHSKYLSKSGFYVTGIDIAVNSIRQAKKSENSSLRFFLHDMRVPFGRDNFDCVFNFFTSFGYFKSNLEHDLVIKNISNALKPGGRLVLDYLNVNYSKKNFIPVEIKEIDGAVYRITRWTDDNYFYKNIKIENLYSGEPAEYTEQVRMFTLENFKDLLETNSLFIQDVFGGYDLCSYERESSKRMIISACRME